MVSSGESLEYVLRTLRHWKTLAACLVLCVAVSIVAAVVQTKQYTSHVQLFVSAQGSGAAAAAIADAYSGDQFTSARVLSYIDLVTSPEISQPVISELHLDLTQTEFDHKVSASAPANTVLLNLAVTDPNPKRAQQIASAVAQQYVKVIYKLETAPRQQSPVRVTVSSPASLPTAPSSPNWKLDIIFGVFVGLLIGVGVAQITEILDNSIKSEDELESVFGLQVLASIPYDSHASDGLSGLASTSALGRLEALRGLRTALRYVDVDNPLRVVVITSCDPNQGKSVTSAAFAVVVADQGQDVVVVEGDLRRPRLARYMGLIGTGEGLAEALSDDRSVEDLVVGVDYPAASDTSGKIGLLRSGAFVPNPSELLGSQRMKILVDGLRTAHDLVVIDAPPLLPVTDAVVLSTISDGVLLVVEPGRTTRQGLRRALDSLARVDARVLGAVVNRTTPGNAGRDRYGYGYGLGYRAEDAAAGPEPSSTTAT